GQPLPGGCAGADARRLRPPPAAARLRGDRRHRPGRQPGLLRRDAPPRRMDGRGRARPRAGGGGRPADARPCLRPAGGGGARSCQLGRTRLFPQALVRGAPLRPARLLHHAGAAPPLARPAPPRPARGPPRPAGRRRDLDRPLGARRPCPAGGRRGAPGRRLRRHGPGRPLARRLAARGAARRRLRDAALPPDAGRLGPQAGNGAAGCGAL
ncbi:MAG: hypothetical protein AVDCRST_MAG27-4027, partial [uncultured Craurococcus sp.]